MITTQIYPLTKGNQVREADLAKETGGSSGEAAPRRLGGLLAGLAFRALGLEGLVVEGFRGLGKFRV